MADTQKFALPDKVNHSDFQTEFMCVATIGGESFQHHDTYDLDDILKTFDGDHVPELMETRFGVFRETINGATRVTTSNTKAIFDEVINIYESDETEPGESMTTEQSIAIVERASRLARPYLQALAEINKQTISMYLDDAPDIPTEEIESAANTVNFFKDRVFGPIEDARSKFEHRHAPAPSP